MQVLYIEVPGEVPRQTKRAKTPTVSRAKLKESDILALWDFPCNSDENRNLCGHYRYIEVCSNADRTNTVDTVMQLRSLAAAADNV